MKMKVAGSGDASAGEDNHSQERGSDQWLYYLKDEARAVLQPGSDAMPSNWAIEETKRLAHILNLTMTVTERTSWEGMPEGWETYPLATLPTVHVNFSPQVGVQKGETRWARGDLNPHDLAITGT